MRNKEIMRYGTLSDENIDKMKEKEEVNKMRNSEASGRKHCDSSNDKMPKIARQNMSICDKA